MDFFLDLRHPDKSFSGEIKATRLHLDKGGYGCGGTMYFGVGLPLFEVEMISKGGGRSYRAVRYGKYQYLRDRLKLCYPKAKVLR